MLRRKAVIREFICPRGKRGESGFFFVLGGVERLPRGAASRFGSGRNLAWTAGFCQALSRGKKAGQGRPDPAGERLPAQRVVLARMAEASVHLDKVPREGTGCVVVAAMYKFVRLEDLEALREPLKEFCSQHDIRGTLLLAHEGINGTVSGSREAIDLLLARLHSDPRLADLAHKESLHDEHPFLRIKIRLKKEIVTLGVDKVDPVKQAGTYVTPKDWNALISDPQVLVIDTRNSYEVELGTFENAVDPKTNSFREFPEFVDEFLKDKPKSTKVAMFCTGGIRCEKSTSLLRLRGFENVYHLEGGILKYLEEVPRQESLWKGQCYVFDDRVAVDHNLLKGTYSECRACRSPLSHADLSHPDYREGLQCSKCVDSLSPEQRKRFEERQRQVELARARSTSHLGPKFPAASARPCEPVRESEA